MPKVLIIDDDEGARMAWSGLLRLEGFEAATADTGYRGIALALAEPADIIFVDLHLPDISGVEVVRALKSHDLQAPIVVITAFPDLDTSIEAVAVGAAGFVEGFLTVEELLDVVWQALSGRTPVRHPALAATVEHQPSEHPLSSLSANRPVPLDQRLRHVVRLIEREGDEAWSTSALATQVCLSESRLRHVFTAVFGLPISRFIRERRLLKAARLLITTRQSFRAIVENLHLPQDPRASRTAFYERFGMLPRAYRNRFWRPSDSIFEFALRKGRGQSDGQDTPSLGASMRAEPRPRK
jgi:DNA-binding NarL/FixJ family response regulator